MLLLFCLQDLSDLQSRDVEIEEAVFLKNPGRIYSFCIVGFCLGHE